MGPPILQCPRGVLVARDSGEVRPRGGRGCLEGALGGGGSLPLGPNAAARGDLRGGHPPADGLGLAPRRARVQLHAPGCDRALPAHARQEHRLPHGLGRQRAPHRAPRAGFVRDPSRPRPALRSELETSPRQDQEGARRGGLAPQLRRGLRARHGGRRGRLRGAVAQPRPLGGLGAAVRDDRRALPASGAAVISRPRREGRGVPEPVPHHVGCGLPDRGRTG